DRSGELGGFGNYSHPPPPAAGRGLNKERHSYRSRSPAESLGGLFSAVVAGNDRSPRARHYPTSGAFHCGFADRVRRRTDKCHAGGFASLREVGVLGEKAIARMNRASAAPAAGFNYLLNVEVGIFRRGCADVNRLVGKTHVEGSRIRVGVDGNGY